MIGTDGPNLLPLPRLLQPLSHHPKDARVSGFRPRKGTPRVRTGCIVCKIRRIKCDEEKPNCRRCTSTGRQCEGYTNPELDTSQSWRHSRMALVSSFVSDRDAGCPEDRQLLYIFRLMSENELSHHFEPTCWTHLVLQLAHTYPSVHHSLCAVGALHRAYLLGEQRSHASQEILNVVSTPLILARYNIAVKCVSEDLSQKGHLPLPILVCCALFTWLEFLRNNFEAGLMHLKSGLEIIRNWSPGSQALHSVTTTYASHYIDESILHLFMRLQTHVAAHGYPSTDFHTTSPMVASVNPAWPTNRYLSISDARHHLDNILLKCFRFVRHKQDVERSMVDFGPTSLSSFKLLQSRDSLVADLTQWQTLYANNFIAAPNMKINGGGILLLESYYLMAKIILNTLLAESERAYDDHTHDFSKLVSMSRRILHVQGGLACSKIVTLDVGVIPLLFFTCLKCRSSSIRNQALSLLKISPEREGIWHRDTLVAASTFKMSLEEDPGIRVYGEKVSDASGSSQMARVSFFNEASKETIVAEISGLVSKLGDLL
ncbi:hypothetical protein F4803DRAFT_577566 [Xylaria telfairii]|nr:hypothetical protein F4803DRAFT_577566 [Xylaria telfairii]